MKLSILIIANLFLQAHSVGYYYRKPGLLTSNSCAMSPCPTCPAGQYMQGCAGYSSAVINGPAPGACTPCTAVTNSIFTSDGGVTDSCPFACNEGFFDSGGRCSPKIYVVQFQVAVALPAASTFNVRKYIASMATLAGISGCAYAPTTLTLNRLYETACTTPPSVIRAAVDTTSAVIANSNVRRLLAPSTASVVTEIRIESNLAKATTVQQSVTASAVNTQLTANAVGTTSTVSAPTVVIVAVVPTSSSKAMSTAPVSTSRVMSTMTALLMSTTSMNQYTTPAPVPPPPDSPDTPDSPDSPNTPATTPTPPAPTSSSNLGIIIGASAGGVVLLAVIVAVAVFFSMGSKKSVHVHNGKINHASNMAKGVLRIPKVLNANAALVYAEVPQHMYAGYAGYAGYPGYPLSNIQIQGM